MAAAVLFLAWMTAEIIALLGIGEYLAGLIYTGLAFSLLPARLSVLACFISLCSPGAPRSACSRHWLPSL
jgi:tetracycline resistance efflux pump